MKRKFLNQLVAVGATAAMVAGLAGCGGPTEPVTDPNPAPDVTQPSTTTDPVADPVDESPYEVITDENGNPIDLGGMEIIIRDWWSSGEPATPNNDYEEAREEYREWCQETYNYTIKELAISDWAGAPQDFSDYVLAGDDGNNYVFTIRPDAATTAALSQGLMYDLATLDCLDFDHNPIFTRNQIDELYSQGDSIYAMYAANNGFAEARAGIYFNKRVLEDAGIDPESIYDMQADGTWTWDAWIQMMDTVQRDKDNDGTIDVYGCGENYGDLIHGFVMSNGGSYVKYDNSGKFVIALEDANTLEGLTKCKEVMDTYDVHASYEADAAWDFYKQDWLSGHFAFYPGQVWECDNVRQMDDEVGFVTFPKGPSAGNNYTSLASDNLYVIPACYSAEKAWALAFAYQLYFGDVPGYEDFIEGLDGLKAGYYAKFDDTRAVDETVVDIIRSSGYEPGELVPNMQIGPDFEYNIYANGPDISSVIEATKTAWQTYIDEANAKR
jgi:hypothetical protein